MNFRTAEYPNGLRRLLRWPQKIGLRAHGVEVLHQEFIVISSYRHIVIGE
jgi:hypothetical protein